MRFLPRMRTRRTWRVLFACLVLVLVTLPLFAATQQSITATEPDATALVHNAWQRAQRLGTYHYDSEIEQISYPSASLANVGRGPVHEQLYVEGETDSAAQQLHLRLWQGTGAALTADQAVEIRMEEGVAQARQGQGEWQPLELGTDLFSPTNDPLTFLTAIKNVTLSEATHNTSQYTFNLDGPALANQMRLQMEDLLRRRGELPPGLQLETSAQYSAIHGEGTLWLDDDGLPARLELALALPPAHNGDQTAATIRTNFSGFDRTHLFGAGGSGFLAKAQLRRWSPTQADLQQVATNLSLLAAALTLVILMVMARRSRWTYGTIAALVILAQVVCPLIQVERLQAASDRINERYGAPASAVAAADQSVTVDSAAALAADDTELTSPDAMEARLAALRTAAIGESEPRSLSRPVAVVQPGPANAPQQQTSGDLTDSDGDGITDEVELTEGFDPNNSDSDNDTLSDGDEYYRLGTDPLSDDTDSDNLSDAKEVAGFLVNSVPYYTDPLNPDTNYDGLPDGAECFGQSLLATTASECPDSDGDGFPDIVDEDNDNDLVPDGVDLSPQTHRGKATPFHKNNPFTFRADGLQANKPLYVNLQLRPTDPAHLTYALNVLDWPANDTRGNIRRYLDTTWADTANTTLRSSDSNAANGDLRVIPMLSVRIPKQVGNFGNLPVQSGAAPLTASSTITDWQNAIDLDKLTPYGMTVFKADENTLEMTAPLIMEADQTGGGRVAFGAHLYYESGAANGWGSDHEVRVIWIVQMLTDVCNDPAQEGTAFCDNPANRHDEQTVLHVYDEEWYLTGMAIEEQHGMGLGIIYEDPATDGDMDKDDQLWFLAHGLANTFVAGSDANSDSQRDLTIAEIARRWDTTSATATERWNLAADAFNVATFTYPHSDHVARAMMSEPQAILNDQFLSAGTPVTAAPTLLYVRENAQRTATLASGSSSGLLDFSAAAVETFADLTWKPYRYNGDQSIWENYALDRYRAEILEARLDAEAAFLPADGTSASRIEADISRLTAFAFYAGIYSGYSSLVAVGSTPLNGDGLETPEAEIATQSGSGINGTAKYYTKTTIKSLTSLKKINAAKGSRTAGLVAVTAITAGLIWESTHEGETAYNAQLATGIIATVAAVTTLVRVARLYRAAHVTVGIAPLTAAVKYSKTTKALKTSAKVGFAFNITEVWGTYFYSAFADGQGADNPALLARVVAGTIVAILFLALSIATLGIFDVLALLFDGIAFIICAATGSSGGVCNGLFGFLTELLAKLFYEVNTFVDLGDPDRLQVSYIHPRIVSPELGMVPANSVNFTVGITNALKPDGPYFNIFRGGRWEEGTIRRSSFAYDITLEPHDLHAGLQLGQMTGAWQPNDAKQRYIYTAEMAEAFPLGARGTGVNVPYNIYLNEGFIVPYEECFVFLFVTKCKTRTMSDSNSINISEAAVYDVLPGSIGGFYTLRDTGAGYQLGWSNSGRVLDFPAMVDADGDGLRSKFAGGSDPNDSKWDTDGDGLNDKFEHEMGTSPINADSDFDGLSDARELVLGTDPHRRDTDFDGLEDAEELAGWEFVYALDTNGAALTTWVRSDPTAADPDADDILDNKEKIFGFHPLVASEPTVLTYNAAITTPYGDAGLYAKSGDTVTYDATVTNELLNRHAYGQLETQLDSGLTNSGAALEDLFLLPTETVQRSTPVQVNGGLDTGVYRMRQAARATIYDPRSATNEAAALYSFNDSTRPYLDLSGSLPGYHATCSGNSCPTLEPNGWVGSALRLDGVNDYLTAPGAVATVAGGAFSLAAWVNPGALPVSPAETNFFLAINTAAGDNRHLLGYSDTNKFVYNDDTTGFLYTTDSYPLNQWYHLVLTVNADNSAVLYIDGVPRLTFSTTVRPAADDQFSIGQEFDGAVAGQFFNGMIDEVALFDRVIAPAEIGALMVIPKPAIDLPFDIYEEHWYDNGIDFYDRSGTEIVATCPDNSPGCPDVIIDGNDSGNGYYVGASDSRVDIEDGPHVTHGQFTQAFWVKMNTFESGVTVFKGDPGGSTLPFVALLPDDDETDHHYGKIQVGFYDGSQITRYTTPGPVINDFRWRHVAVTYDGNQYVIYVDGERVADSGTMFNGKRPPFGGSYDLNTPFNVTGIDEVQLYQVVLTAAQVKAIYGGGFNLITHVPFDDAPGSTTFDNASDLGTNGYCSGNSCPITSLPGLAGRAAQFSSSEGDKVEIPHSNGNVPMQQVTVAAWVKGSGPILLWTKPNNDELLRLDTNSFFVRSYCGNGGHCRVGTDSEETESLSFPANAVPSNQWTHIAVTFDGQFGAFYEYDSGTGQYVVSEYRHQMHVYVNGQKVASQHNGPTGSILPSTNPLLIGDGFDGLIDDLRIYGTTLISTEITSLYESTKPVLWHRLEETENATSFDDAADNVANSTCTSCPQTEVKGQLGLSAHFAGAEWIEAADNGTAAFGGSAPFSVGAWVRPDLNSGLQMLVSKNYAVGGDFRGYYLALNDGRPRFWRAGTTVNNTLDGPSTLPTGVWSHLYATFDGTTGRLYLNGQLVASDTGWGSQSTNDQSPLLIGAERNNPVGAESSFFYGNIDEVTLYAAALDDRAIERIYDDEVTWVEERSRFALTVDNDNPETSIRSDYQYRANQPTIFDIYANDPTSPISQVELLVNNVATAAPACLDAQDEGAYCPTFTPSDEGAYTLVSRATDTVGHQTTSTAVNLLVDATAPNVTLSSSLPTPTRATPHPTELQRWQISLVGSALDPLLNTGAAGSGLQALAITLYDANGAIAGEGTQQVTVDGSGNWTLDYLFFDDPDGLFTVEAVAVDRVGNQRTVTLTTVQFDGTAPQVAVTTSLPQRVISETIVVGGVITDLVQISGIVTETGAGLGSVELAFVPSELGSPHHTAQPMADLLMHLPLDDDDGATTLHDLSGNGHNGICTACPALETKGHLGNAARFNGSSNSITVPSASGALSDGNRYTVAGWFYLDADANLRQTLFSWNRADDSASTALFYDPASRFFGVDDGTTTETTNIDSYAAGRWYHLALVNAGGAANRLYVNGAMVLGPPLAQPVTNTDLLRVGALGIESAPSEFFAGVADEVQLYDRPLTSAEVGTLYRGSAALLHLDFEAPFVTDGLTLTEQSGWQQRLTLQSGDALNKTEVGIVGDHALRFDGVDDHLRVAEVATLAAGDAFAFGGWLNPASGPSAGEGAILAFATTDNSARNTLRYAYGTDQLVYADGGSNTTLPGTYGRDEWHHLFVTVASDGQTIVYVNATPVLTTTSTLRPTAAGLLEIGRQRGAGGTGINHFTGALDELLVYPRVLSVLEVQALYRHGWQTASRSGNSWSAPIPAGMEGLFEIEVRATDAVGNVSGRQSIWRGIIDNMAPRLITTATGEIASLNRFGLMAAQTTVRTTAQDFNLATNGFSTGCGLGQIDQQAQFTADWYLAFTDQTQTNAPRLYTLAAECPAESNRSYTNACDQYGNCRLASVPALPQASIANQSVTEGTLLTFPVVLDRTYPYPLEIDYQMRDASATAATDYSASSGTLVIPADAISATIALSTTNDDVVEGIEVFTVAISSTTIAITNDRATVTIIDDDQALFNIAAVAGAESSGQLTFTVSTAQPLAAGATVYVSTQDKGATTADNDYTPLLNKAVTIDTTGTATVAVPIGDDAKVEADETFTLTIGFIAADVIGMNVAAGTDGVGTILNDDGTAFMVGAVTVNEAATVATVPLTLTAASDFAVTINYTTTDGVALADSDYQQTVGTATVAAGARTAAVTIPILDDLVVEAATESFGVTLTSPNATGSEGSVVTATVTIVDDDSSTLSLNDATAPEAVGALPFVLALTNPVDRAITVELSTGDGNATVADGDYVALVDQQIIFPAGTLSQTITVSVTDDLRVELDESFRLIVVGATTAGRAVGTTAAAAGTIQNDESSRVSISDGAVAEAAGSLPLVVALSNPVDSDVTVYLNTADESATMADGDYVALTDHALFFGAGTITQTLSITINDDAKVEADERITVWATALESNRRAVLTDTLASVGTGTVTNDDSVTLTVAAATAVESAATLDFTVTLSALSDFAVQVDYATVSETINSGDYTPISGTLTIPAGVLSTTLSVPLLDNNLYEITEYLWLEVSNPVQASLAVTNVLGTLLDDEPMPRIGVGDFTVGESDGALVIPLQLDAPSEAWVWVRYSTANHARALDGFDYVQIMDEARFVSGQLTTTVTIPIISDGVDEEDETFAFRLFSPVNVVISNTEGTITILDDDTRGLAVSIDEATLSEEGNVRSYTVALESEPTEPVELTLYSGGDQVQQAGDGSTFVDHLVLNFDKTNWQTPQPVTLRAVDDSAGEGTHESIIYHVLYGGDYTTLTNAPITVTISDNDLAYTVVADQPSVTEGDSGVTAVRYTITRTGVITLASSVDFALGGTAQAIADYTNVLPVSGTVVSGTVVSGTVVFAADQVSTTVTLDVVGDNRFEYGETVELTLSNGAASGLSGDIGYVGNPALLTILNDDDPPTLTLHDGSALEGAGTMVFTATLDVPSGIEIFVNFYSTADSTGATPATEGDDYTGLFDAFQFIQPGQTLITIPVTLLDDGAIEADETFILRVGDYSNVNVAAMSATGTIRNDDFAATPTPTLTPTSRPSPTATTTNTPTPTGTATATNTPLPTATPSDMPAATTTDTPTVLATNPPVGTPVNTVAPTDTAIPTETVTPTGTAIPANTAMPTATQPATATGVETPTATPTPTLVTPMTPTPTATATVSGGVVSIPTPPVVVVSEEADLAHPEASTAGRFTIDATFVNDGQPLSDLFFVVTQLRSEDPTLLHFLLNTDEPPGQEGATLTIANSTLPGGNGLWETGEMLPVQFEIGLMARRAFVFSVDLYARTDGTIRVSNGMESDGRLIRSFDFVYDPAQQPTAAQPQIYLPIVQRSGIKLERDGIGDVRALCRGTLCLVADR